MRRKPNKRNIPSEIFEGKYSGQLKEINRARRDVGLPEIKKKQRQCLNCDKWFDSSIERLCANCGQSAARKNNCFTDDYNV